MILTTRILNGPKLIRQMQRVQSSKKSMRICCTKWNGLHLPKPCPAIYMNLEYDLNCDACVFLLRDAEYSWCRQRNATSEVTSSCLIGYSDKEGEGGNTELKSASNQPRFLFCHVALCMDCEHIRMKKRILPAIVRKLCISHLTYGVLLFLPLVQVECRWWHIATHNPYTSLNDLCGPNRCSSRRA